MTAILNADLHTGQGRATLIFMSDRSPPELDMTLDGEFVAPPRPTVASRVLLWALVIAIVAGAITIAALALWLAMLVLPIAIGAALVAYGIFRFQVWRGQKSFGGERDLRHT